MTKNLIHRAFHIRNARTALTKATNRLQMRNSRKKSINSDLTIVKKNAHSRYITDVGSNNNQL